METYYVENDKIPSIKVDGKYIERIRAKHIKAYGEDGSKNIFKNALALYEKAMKILNDSTVTNNILVVGKVQSGKTSNLEMFTALAFDNGYNAVIIYGGYDNTLLRQTIGRFKETFDILEDDFDSDSPALFATDGEQIDDLDEEILDEIFDIGKPTIFVSMKRPVALNRINYMISKLNVEKIKSFIIDDEGDQASLNTQFRKNKKSPTYDAICSMKNNLQNPLYLSVTATPQANIFQYEMSSLRPADVKLIAPGNGYTGANEFHLKEDNIIVFDDIQTDSEILANSLKSALYHFFISSGIMIKRGLKYSDMIIHTDRSVSKHSALYSTIASLIENMQLVIKAKDEDWQLYLNEMRNVYNEKFFNKEIIEAIPFDSLINNIEEVIKKSFIVLQNSRGKETMANSNYKRHKIYIGGDLLQRGVTFKFLVTTYFTRWAKSGNMDTVLQRCRWFGYRGKYLDICRIFTTKSIMGELCSLASIENDLWNQFVSVENGDLLIDDIIVDGTGSSLSPTRKNIGDIKQIHFKHKWYNQRIAEFNPPKIKHNNMLFESILNNNNFKWIPTDKGRTDGEKRFSYSYIPTSVFDSLVNDSYTIFENNPFHRIEILRAIKDKKIVLIKMFNDFEPTRERTFIESSISALQQGADKVDVNLRKYLGDSSVIVDDTAINVQVFKIHPKNMGCEYTQYMISIHYPNEKKGFTRKNR